MSKLRPQPDWKPERLSRQYESVARDAERYIEQCKNGAKTREGYKKLHDEHVAKFYLYNYLYGRTFLESPQLLWNALQNLLIRPPVAPSECFEKEWFDHCYLAYVRGEIGSLEESAPANADEERTEPR